MQQIRYLDKLIGMSLPGQGDGRKSSARKPEPRKTAWPPPKSPPVPEANACVKAVFDDIRATRKTDFINNPWRSLAFDPALLENTWAECADGDADHAGPADQGADLHRRVDRQFVQLLRAFAYRRREGKGGMTDAQHAELLAIVPLAAKTNHLANGLQVQVDAVFDAGASSRTARPRDLRLARAGYLCGRTAPATPPPA